MNESLLKTSPNPKILVVDDIPQNIFVMQKLLKKLPIEIFTAQSGNEALSLTLRHSFALVLLDVQMPEMDGFEVAAIMRENQDTKNTPIIFVTALSKEEKYVFEGYQSGAVDYLFKPINPTILMSKVSVFLELNRQKLELEEEISRRKIVERDLEIAKMEADSANQAKSSFLANMSHEIRTPMNAILGYAQILKRDKRLEEDQKQAINTISKSGNNLLALINDVLDISKIEAGGMELHSVDFELIDLIGGLKDMFQVTCEKKNLFLNVEGLEDSIPVYGDEGKIRQILTNLIGNAVKFTDAGGIYFKLERVEDHMYCFSVKDTGKGLPLEAQATIFRAFQQDSEGHEKGGAGLGLAISKKQTELMGGDLSVESEVGDGATFFLKIPLPPAKEEIEARMDRNLEVVRLKEGQKVRALVADDIEENRSLLSKFLTDVGIEVVQVENGKEALESFRQNRSDIIFMDIRMPVMGGVEAIKKLRDEFPENELNIVIVSASVLKHEREEYEKLGCVEILQKPFRMEQVYQSTEKLLEIEFEYEEKAADNDSDSIPVQIDYSEIGFPNDIIGKLKEAAEMCSVTEIERLLNSLDHKNNHEKAFIKKFTDYKNKYDSDGMIKILGDINLNS
jgi:signal transduction histidine kinase